MDYAGESIGSARGTSDDDSYGISAVDMLDEPMEDDLDVEEVETPTLALSAAEPGTIDVPRVSYGLADILFPMTPPKPKGARLIRGPLRFN
jgi:hypothetical protein